MAAFPWFFFCVCCWFFFVFVVVVLLEESMKKIRKKVQKDDQRRFCWGTIDVKKCFKLRPQCYMHYLIKSEALFWPVLTTCTWSASVPRALLAVQVYFPKSFSSRGIMKMLRDLFPFSRRSFLSFDQVIFGVGFPSAWQVNVELWWSHELITAARPVLFSLGLSWQKRKSKQVLDQF